MSVSVEDTSQAMFGFGRLNPITMLQVFRELKMIFDLFKGKSNTESQSGAKNNFTGQHTDIAYVSESGSLNAAEIENIPDEKLRSSVMKSYSEAVKDGYLDFDNQNRVFTLTDKGKQHINSESFMRQFEKDQAGAISNNKAQIYLRGNPSDLNVFRYTDSINLNHLAHNDPAAFKRVQDYFYHCQKHDFVKISPDGTVHPTEKCMRYLNQTTIVDYRIRKVTPDNISEVADELKNVSKTVGKKITKESAKNVSSEASQKVAQEAARKASQEATKKAAQKTAVKGAAKTAGTAVAGTASMGIGTAVSAVVDLSAKGAKALTNLNTQDHKPTLQNRG